MNKDICITLKNVESIIQNFYNINKEEIEIKVIKPINKEQLHSTTEAIKYLKDKKSLYITFVSNNSTTKSLLHICYVDFYWRVFFYPSKEENFNIDLLSCVANICNISLQTASYLKLDEINALFSSKETFELGLELQKELNKSNTISFEWHFEDHPYFLPKKKKIDMNTISKIKFTSGIYEGEFGFQETDSNGKLLRIYNKDGDGLNLSFNCEFEFVEELGKFDDEDNYGFYKIIFQTTERKSIK